MKDIFPVNQTQLFGINEYLYQLINLYNSNKLPNKILLSGDKGIGKSTLAYHLINYVLSIGEKNEYNLDNCKINEENHSFKITLNKSNPNLKLIDIEEDKKKIDIDQIRNLIVSLNKSSLNEKPRFVLIDNIEFLNISSINSLLKVLEEPNFNVHFILINNNKKVLPTLTSRCINFKIYLNNKKCLEIANLLLDGQLDTLLNKELINYYISPGNIYNLVKFGKQYKYDLFELDLKELLQIIINKNHFKKDKFFNFIFFDLIENFYRLRNSEFSMEIDYKYHDFLKRLSEVKKYNLDNDILFTDFEENVLNG